MFNYNKETYYKTRSINEEKRREIAQEFISKNTDKKELAKKYGVSEYSIGKWIKEYLTEEEISKIKEAKEKSKPVEKNNLAKILKFEDEFAVYGRFGKGTPNGKIMSFYKDTLKIGEGVDLTVKQARREINKLLHFITTDDFYNEYGRKFNLVDMYLTTNIQVKDILNNYYDYMLEEEYTPIYHFILEQLKSIDNESLKSYNNSSKIQISSRFERPVNKSIEDIKSCKFLFYKKLRASEIDANNAYEILLDLNKKYGVKYDDISYFIILREYIINKENINSFYALGEKYKKDLDLYSHVQVRCIPALTRREKNK